jgi:hypothetical protein
MCRWPFAIGLILMALLLFGSTVPSYASGHHLSPWNLLVPPPPWEIPRLLHKYGPPLPVPIPVPPLARFSQGYYRSQPHPGYRPYCSPHSDQDYRGYDDRGPRSDHEMRGWDDGHRGWERECVPGYRSYR